MTATNTGYPFTRYHLEFKCTRGSLQRDIVGFFFSFAFCFFVVCEINTPFSVEHINDVDVINKTFDVKVSCNSAWPKIS